MYRTVTLDGVDSDNLKLPFTSYGTMKISSIPDALRRQTDILTNIYSVNKLA